MWVTDAFSKLNYSHRDVNPYFGTCMEHLNVENTSYYNRTPSKFIDKDLM